MHNVSQVSVIHVMLVLNCQDVIVKAEAERRFENIHLALPSKVTVVHNSITSYLTIQSLFFFHHKGSITVYIICKIS